MASIILYVWFISSQVNIEMQKAIISSTAYTINFFVIFYVFNEL